MINFTTGPVTILPAVAKALASEPLSHRSRQFKDLYHNTTAAICTKLNANCAYIMTGSGTLANEMMIAQISLLKTHGLILANGEFGNRLIEQARRQQLNFDIINVKSGGHFDIDSIASVLKTGKIKWLLFCHCESSTGVVNPLLHITELCNQFGCEVYADCMSTFGAVPLDLQRVSMATASSGKGIGSYAGLALIFCNKKITPFSSLPFYLDLGHFQKTSGIPFTLSSNLLVALETAVALNLTEDKWAQLDLLSRSAYKILCESVDIPFATPASRIFTITGLTTSTTEVGALLSKDGIELSHQSSYLIRSNNMQLALLGSYDHDNAIRAIKHCAATFSHANVIK